MGALAALAWQAGAPPAAAPPAHIEGARPAGRPAAPARPAVLVGDAALRGEVDLARAVVRDGRYEVPLARGRRAVLTLDPAIQSAAEQVLDRAQPVRGAVVVLAPDGRILALAGRGDGGRADPSVALRAWAPAASVFKVVTAAALVRAGVDPAQRVCYHGGLRSVEAAHLRDDPNRDRECHDLAFAVARSQNAIIAKLAHRFLDRARLADMAARLGFGARPATALAAEIGTAELPAGGLELARVAAGFWHTRLSALGGALLAN
ncbi:MAG: penicillin-binding protein, partial [Deltaproteobacteria bacterium]